MTAEQLREIVKRLQTLSRKLRSDGPQTDDELHAWIKQNLGVDVPRVSVCPDHDPPFKLIADCYFERLTVNIGGIEYPIQAVLTLANRGGSKTHSVAILHFLNATFKPGCGCLQFGATEQQGKRCYENIEDWCYEHDRETGRRKDQVHDFIKGEPMRSETNWKTGSKVEVVAGSEKAVSGPHPQKAGADEVDQMDRPVWEQSRGMAVAKQATGPLPEFMARYNGMIPPQDVVSSTRNSRHGLMQELLDEVEEDLKNGNIPAFVVIIWCIWETVAEVPHCRRAPASEREARLKELDNPLIPCGTLCHCNKIVKGRNRDGSPRTLEQVCDGKAFRSRGWKPYVDLVSTFKRNTPGTWMLQHECREARDENNYIQDWSLEDYGVRGFEPDPRNGPIYQGIDWGATNPAVVLWFQYLRAEVAAYDFQFEPIFLQAGIYVLFREIYVAGIDSPKLASRVIAIENGYRAQYGPRWRVKGRFMDPQGKDARIHFKHRGIGGSWPIQTRNKETMITTVQNVVMDDRFAVDPDNCPMFCEEIEQWGKDEKTGKEIDKFNHAMSAWRYGIANAEVKEGHQKAGRGGAGSQKPKERKAPRERPEHLVTAEGVTKHHGPVAFATKEKTEMSQFDQALDR